MKKWICFDFDGVIAKYSGWRGFDVLGDPNTAVIETMILLKKSGSYMITIFTTRPFTPTMDKWLKENNVPYDSINSNAHNPPMTSQKPIYHAFIDDRAIRYTNQDILKLYDEILKVIGDAK